MNSLGSGLSLLREEHQWLCTYGDEGGAIAPLSLSAGG